MLESIASLSFTQLRHFFFSLKHRSERLFPFSEAGASFGLKALHDLAAHQPPKLISKLPSPYTAPYCSTLSCLLCDGTERFNLWEVHRLPEQRKLNITFLPLILEGHLVCRFLKYRIRILGQLASVSEPSDGRAGGDGGPSSVNQVPG